jgi:hypothetical protein
MFALPRLRVVVPLRPMSVEDYLNDGAWSCPAFIQMLLASPTQTNAAKRFRDADSLPEGRPKKRVCLSVQVPPSFGSMRFDPYLPSLRRQACDLSSFNARPVSFVEEALLQKIVVDLRISTQVEATYYINAIARGEPGELSPIVRTALYDTLAESQVPWSFEMNCRLVNLLKAIKLPSDSPPPAVPPRAACFLERPPPVYTSDEDESEAVVPKKRRARAWGSSSDDEGADSGASGVAAKSPDYSPPLENLPPINECCPFKR